MTSRDFAFWLQGFFEITGTNKIDEGQAEIIKNHLNLVFKHEIDPSLNGSKSKEEVQDLQDIHDGKVEKPTPPPSKIIRDGEDPSDGKVDWEKIKDQILKDLMDRLPPKKHKDDLDWFKDKFKPSHIKPNGGFSSGSSSGEIYRC